VNWAKSIKNLVPYFNPSLGEERKKRVNDKPKLSTAIEILDLEPELANAVVAACKVQGLSTNSVLTAAIALSYGELMEEDGVRPMNPSSRTKINIDVPYCLRHRFPAGEDDYMRLGIWWSVVPLYFEGTSSVADLAMYHEKKLKRYIGQPGSADDMNNANRVRWVNQYLTMNPWVRIITWLNRKTSNQIMVSNVTRIDYINADRDGLKVTDFVCSITQEFPIYSFFCFLSSLDGKLKISLAFNENFVSLDTAKRLHARAISHLNRFVLVSSKFETKGFSSHMNDGAFTAPSSPSSMVSMI